MVTWGKVEWDESNVVFNISWQLNDVIIRRAIAVMTLWVNAQMLCINYFYVPCVCKYVVCSKSIANFEFLLVT